MTTRTPSCHEAVAMCPRRTNVLYGRPELGICLRSAYPGLTSWGILSRPWRDWFLWDVKPRTMSWATLSHPLGTVLVTP
jgi:hypothetical protein